MDSLSGRQKNAVQKAKKEFSLTLLEIIAYMSEGLLKFQRVSPTSWKIVEVSDKKTKYREFW